MELNHVSLTRQPKAEGVNAEPASSDDTWPRLRAGVMYPLMKNPALGGEAVFFPLLLDVDQTPLPLAELQML